MAFTRTRKIVAVALISTLIALMGFASTKASEPEKVNAGYVTDDLGIRHGLADFRDSIIIVQGEIPAGYAEWYISTATRKVKESRKLLVIINSDGGEFADGYKIGKFHMWLQREKGVTVATMVGERNQCSSACFMIFATGNVRLVDKTSQYGFHQGNKRMYDDERTLQQILDADVIPRYEELLNPYVPELMGYLKGNGIVYGPTERTFSGEEFLELFPMRFTEIPNDWKATRANDVASAKSRELTKDEMFARLFKCTHIADNGATNAAGDCAEMYEELKTKHFGGDYDAYVEGRLEFWSRFPEYKPKAQGGML